MRVIPAFSHHGMKHLLWNPEKPSDQLSMRGCHNRAAIFPV